MKKLGNTVVELNKDVAFKKIFSVIFLFKTPQIFEPLRVVYSIYNENN